MRKLSLFEILLLLILAVPNLLGFTLSENLPKVLFLNLLVATGFVLHLKGVRVKIPLWVSVPLGFAFLGYLVFDFSINELPERLYTLSDILIFLQLLSGDAFRTYLYLSLLSFLNLAVVSVNFNNLLYGFVLFIYLLGLVYFFLLLAAKGFGKLTPRVYRALTLYSLIVYAAVFAAGVVLFYLLPRPSQPIFTLLAKKKELPVVAFSNGVGLGSFSDIAQDPTVVFRAKLENYKGGELYWRGNTLEIFKHGLWLSTSGYTKRVYLDRPPSVLQTLIILPYGGKNAFTLGFPQAVEGADAYIDREKGIVLFRKTPLKAVSLKVRSTLKPRVFLLSEEPLLGIPKEVKPLLERFAEENNLRRGKTFEETLEGLAKAFSRFEYSLTNPARNLEEFLFKYRRGNCEYFATAATLLLRYLGYPSRLVVGFYGGQFNPITGFYVVRQRDAHAWTEVYYNGTWVRVDATRFVGKVSSPSLREGVSSLERDKLALLWDTLNTFWLQYVVNLNKERQLKVLQNLKGFFEKSAPRAVESLPLFLPFALVFALYLTRRRFVSFLFRLYLRLRYGIDAEAETPAGIYNLLWSRYPDVLLKERRRLLLLLRVFGG